MGRIVRRPTCRPLSSRWPGAAWERSRPRPTTLNSTPAAGTTRSMEWWAAGWFQLPDTITASLTSTIPRSVFTSTRRTQSLPARRQGNTASSRPIGSVRWERQTGPIRVTARRTGRRVWRSRRMPCCGHGRETAASMFTKRAVPVRRGARSRARGTKPSEERRLTAAVRGRILERIAAMW